MVDTVSTAFNLGVIFDSQLCQPI